jgi:magnesium transporter
MLKFEKGRSKKSGLAPGTPVLIGKSLTKEPTIEIIEYSETEFIRLKNADLTKIKKPQEKDRRIWVNVNGIEINTLQKIGEIFSIHPLVIEDIVNTDQRPKCEEYDENIYTVLKMINISTDEVEFEQLSIVFGKNYVITIQEQEGDIYEPIRERIQLSKGEIRKNESDYLAYALIDSTVDHYFKFLEDLGEEIEELEEEIVGSPKMSTMRQVHALKLELIMLRRVIWPLREAIGALLRSDNKLISKKTKIYLRDVYDHVIYTIDQIETYRDIVSGMLDIYLSSLSNKINEVMKVLTVITTIFMPLSFIAGVYGMNFENMPELKNEFGYPLVLAFMGIIGISMFLYFRNKKWI